MDILMASSELAPIVKVGGLADAVAALSKTLSRLEAKVTIALPRSPAVDQAGLMLARRLTPLKIEVGEETIEATLFDARISSGVELLLIDLPGVFVEDEIYTGDIRDGRRYGLFCRAVAQLVEARERAGTPFDAVHAHDWPTALLPFLLRARREERKRSSGSKDEGVRTVLTLHNAAHQGRFPKKIIDDIGLSWDDFHPAGLEFYGDVNLLKAGVLSADKVTTVSPSYAEEITQPGGGSGLDGVFRDRGDDFVGILNGIDYAQWSPSSDPHIAARFDAEDVSNKGRCKVALLNELDLPLEPDRPLLVCLGRVDQQKGSDVLAQALSEIVRTGARVVIAGTGDAELVALLEDAAASAGDDAIYLGAVSEPMTHRLVSAADAILMPSRFEPCGLVQQYAQRYGAPPIVTAVGGLRDTVVDCDAHLETGTGFTFAESTVEALIGAAGRAVSAMKTPQWAVLRRRVMRLDHSWERSARRYLRLYEAA